MVGTNELGNYGITKKSTYTRPTPSRIGTPLAKQSPAATQQSKTPRNYSGNVIIKFKSRKTLKVRSSKSHEKAKGSPTEGIKVRPKSKKKSRKVNVSPPVVVDLTNQQLPLSRESLLRNNDQKSCYQIVFDTSVGHNTENGYGGVFAPNKATVISNITAEEIQRNETFDSLDEEADAAAMVLKDCNDVSPVKQQTSLLNILAVKPSPK